jgi:hypothetical protein
MPDALYSAWCLHGAASDDHDHTTHTIGGGYGLGVPGRPKSLERFDRARALRAHAHVYKYTHAHWSTTTGPYHYGSAQDTIYPTGSGLYCFCPRAALA